MVGDRGIKLSGGQRQRLFIARELYRNPNILILDEATSALDSKSESNIQSSIENFQGELSIIIIAHRLSTIKNADQVFILENGHIIESGTYFELKQEEGSTLNKLIDLQNHKMQFLKEKLLNFLVKALAANVRLIRRFDKVQLEIPFISKNLSDDIFGSFKKDDGVRINLYKNYRWNLKKGWKYYQSLNLMDELNKRFVLEKSSLNFLRTSVNEHTLTRSLDEINQFLKKKVKNSFQKHLLVDQKIIT